MKHEVSGLLGCDAEAPGNWFPGFKDNVVVSSSSKCPRKTKRISACAAVRS
jgi:hypothetical protein